MAFGDWPIRRKLTAMFLLISGLVLLLTSAAFIGYQHLSLRQTTRNSLSALGRVIAANSTASLAFANEADASEILSALRAEPHVVAAALYDRRGRLFARYPANISSDALPVSPALEGYRFEQGHLIGFQPVAEAANQRLGTLYLDSDLKALYDTLRLSALIAAAVMAVSLLTAYLLSMVLQGTISQPILTLAQTATAVSERRDYSVRAPAQGRDELGVLTRAFNHMLGRIEEQSRALHESKERLDLALQSAGVGTWSWDLATNLVAWDDFARSLFGLSSNTADKAYPEFLALVHPDDRERTTRETTVSLENDVRYDTEYRVVWPDGTERALASRGKVYRDAVGKPVRMSGVCLDITERRLAAEQRQAREAAEASNRAKSNFLASMSHELRTPLNAIIGFSELLESHTFGDLNDRQQRYVTNVLTSGRHLLQLINDILDLSKVEAGHMELALSAFDIRTTLGEVRTIVGTLATKKHLGLEVEVEDSITTVTADQSKFKQILYNLLSNAIKFTPEGGSVRVTVRAAAEVGAKRGGDWIEVAVADTGIGLRPEDQERIFGTFEQVDSAYAREQQGTGLGLTLSRRFVELHGGHIWVESEFGKGSVFRFALPLKAHAVTTEAPLDKAGAAGVGGNGPLVLVVEDDKQAGEVLANDLVRGGYRVARAATGEQAVALARSLQPDAITLDVLLPDQDGLKVLARLKGLPETRAIPVVIVSLTEGRELGFSLGAVDWLVKPANPANFLAAVRKAINGTGAETQTVLVVDDEPPTVELLTDMLRNHGFRVLAAHDGRRGVEIARTERPNLIVLDLVMPGLTGFEVVQELREHPETREIPILIFTVKDLNAEERERLKGSVRAVVTKGAAGDLLRELARVQTADGRRMRVAAEEPG